MVLIIRFSEYFHWELLLRPLLIAEVIELLKVYLRICHSVRRDHSVNLHKVFVVAFERLIYLFMVLSHLCQVLEIDLI
jgi:hypothetical protein